MERRVIGPKIREQRAKTRANAAVVVVIVVMVVVMMVVVTHSCPFPLRGERHIRRSFKAARPVAGSPLMLPHGPRAVAGYDSPGSAEVTILRIPGVEHMFIVLVLSILAACYVNMSYATDGKWSATQRNIVRCGHASVLPFGPCPNSPSAIAV